MILLLFACLVPVSCRQRGQFDGPFNPTTINFNSRTGEQVQSQIFSPYNRSSPVIAQGGVSLQFSFRSYSNPGGRLPGDRFCVCPPGQLCSYAPSPPLCRLSFIFFVSSPDESVRYFSTNFYTLDGNSELSGSGMMDQVIQLPYKPAAIDVFVLHKGMTISANGQLFSMDDVAHVDTFVVPLKGEIPAVGGVQDMQRTHQFVGQLLNTRLSLSLSISCSGSLIGPDCDLACNMSSINARVAACKSEQTGFFYICNYAVDRQVDNCNGCPWGIKENTFCQDRFGEVLDPATAGVVGDGFRTATIVLSVLCLLLLLLLSLLILPWLLSRNRKPRGDSTLPGHNYHSSLARDDSQQDRPLVVPTPAPRSLPSLDATPQKSSLRKPLVPPPAHLGGSNSINDTLNSSFASDVPMRPSRSEVV